MLVESLLIAESIIQDLAGCSLECPPLFFTLNLITESEVSATSSLAGATPHHV